MFGYIKPFKPELKIRDFESYKAVYCGLCGELGRSFGLAARLSLNYDFTFASMLYFSLSGTDAEIFRRRCHVNPFKTTPYFHDPAALGFGAGLTAAMLYQKLRDNAADSRLLEKAGWLLLSAFAAPARKKAAKAMPEADEIVSGYMLKQSRVELVKRPSLDESAEPTAEALSRLFRMTSPDEKICRVLERFGYFLGRYVYVCDALDDIVSDLKSGNYNPIILKFGVTKEDVNSIRPAAAAARDSLYMTIGEAAKAYDMLELYEFKPVLDNIVRLGLRNTVDEIYARSCNTVSRL